MARYIQINSCATCPHRDHKGAFGEVAYVPLCKMTNMELPWQPHENIRGRVTAKSTHDIPGWCPLPKFGE